ncbi:MAG TPA: lipid II flippase MurJ, partial [Roseiflexaceae bacterium]|nr:lipid II flippase MurJ [Roseiflexaceae bacterium]
ETVITARALRLYLPGLPAAALDQLLLFAFYARRRTLAPNLVQGAAIAFYAATALGLLATTTLRMEALVLGNSAQWIAHLVILAVLSRRLINLGGMRLGEAALKGLIASLLVATAAWWVAGATPGGALLQISAAAITAAALYVGACMALRVEALSYFTQMVMRRVRRA